MVKREKLFAAIRSGRNNVRFADACKAAELLGFAFKAAKGSHHSYSRTGEPVGLNFQNRDGKVAPYQVRQLIAMMDKYEETE